MFGVRSASQKTRQRVGQKDPGRVGALQSDLQCEFALLWLCISSTKLLSFQTEGNKRLWGVGKLGTQFLVCQRPPNESLRRPRNTEDREEWQRVTEQEGGTDD